MQGIKRVRQGKAEQVWDTVPHKVLIYIEGAKNIKADKEREYAAVIYHDGKSIGKTGWTEKTRKPEWNETFFFEATGLDFHVEVRQKRGKGRSPLFVGQCKLGDPMGEESSEQCRDTVHDAWYPLLPSKVHKSRSPRAGRSNTDSPPKFRIPREPTRPLSLGGTSPRPALADAFASEAGRSKTFAAAPSSRREVYATSDNTVRSSYRGFYDTDATKETTGSDLGMIRVRILYSDLVETRPTDRRTNSLYRFHYEHALSVLKPGDLVCYEGVGVVPNSFNVISNSRFSSVGLVVELENKYTEELELYLLEVTRNIDLLSDEFSDLVRNGVTLVKVKERFHQFFGGAIVLYPISVELAPAQVSKLRKYAIQLHSQSDPLVDLTRTHPQLFGPNASSIGKTLDFLRTRFAIDGFKRLNLVTELFSVVLIAGGLEEALSTELPLQDYTPLELTKTKVYQGPQHLVLRTRRSRPKPKEDYIAGASPGSAESNTSPVGSPPTVDRIRRHATEQPRAQPESYSRWSDRGRITQSRTAGLSAQPPTPERGSGSYIGNASSAPSSTVVAASSSNVVAPASSSSSSSTTGASQRRLHHHSSNIQHGQYGSGVAPFSSFPDWWEPTLRLQVPRAADLAKKDFFSSDPYCRVYLEADPTVAYTTEVIRNTLSPEWAVNEFVFSIPSSEHVFRAIANQTVVIEVWDADVLSADDYIGRINIPFASFGVLGQDSGRWFELADNWGKFAGRILVTGLLNGVVDPTSVKDAQAAQALAANVGPSGAFIDQSFPPSLASLFGNDKDGLLWKETDGGATVVWKRPAQFIGGPPTLFGSNKNSTLNAQQLLSSHPLLAAAGLGASGVDCASHLVVASDFAKGFHQFLLPTCRGGFSVISVDDTIPCWPDGGPRFSFSKKLNSGRAVETNGVWLLLLEKAMAKVHGSYDILFTHLDRIAKRVRKEREDRRSMMQYVPTHKVSDDGRVWTARSHTVTFRKVDGFTVDTLWKTITDFLNYPLWNTVIPEIYTTPHKNMPLKVDTGLFLRFRRRLGTTAPHNGELRTVAPPSSDYSKDKYKMAVLAFSVDTGSRHLPDFLLQSPHGLVLELREDVNGDVLFDVWQDFTGLFLFYFKMMRANDIIANFTQMANDLRRFLFRRQADPGLKLLEFRPGLVIEPDETKKYKVLTVRVHEAQNLAVKGGKGGLAGFFGMNSPIDPYVLLWIKGWRLTTYQTLPKAGSASPRWDEEFQFALTDHNAPIPPESILQADVFNRTSSTTGASDYLGSIEDFSLDQLRPGVPYEAWFPLHPTAKFRRYKVTGSLKLSFQVNIALPPKLDTALAIHVRFFDWNNDGVITPQELMKPLQQMGLSKFLSYTLAMLISGGLPTLNVARLETGGGRHPDSGTWKRPDGSFDEEAFEKWWYEADTDYSGGLTTGEIIRQAWKMDKDPILFLAHFGEFQVIHMILSENGELSKDNLRDFMTGDYFKALVSARRRELGLGKLSPSSSSVAAASSSSSSSPM